jgi:hypothetical protein
VSTSSLAPAVLALAVGACAVRQASGPVARTASNQTAPLRETMDAGSAAPHAANEPKRGADEFTCGAVECSPNEYCENENREERCRPLPKACRSNATCACLFEAHVAMSSCHARESASVPVVAVDVERSADGHVNPQSCEFLRCKPSEFCASVSGGMPSPCDDFDTECRVREPSRHGIGCRPLPRDCVRTPTCECLRTAGIPGTCGVQSGQLDVVEHRP